jgi:ABC-type transport system substrate-binding protein
MQKAQKQSYLINNPILLLIVHLFLIFNYWGERAWADSTIKIGLLQKPKTLNIWLASDAWSRKVLGLIYQPLYIREPRTLRLIPWLAEDDPVYDPATLSYTVRIRSARWSDGSELTSEDVAFTGNFIKEFRVPRYISRWEFIEKIVTPDKHTVKFFLKEPKAIFHERTLTTPIVQKKEWFDVISDLKSEEKPLTKILNKKIEKPIGSGPFVFKEWKHGAYLFLENNESFFGRGKKIGGHILGPYIDGTIFTINGSSDAAIQALKKGTIDMFWWGIRPGYLQDLKGEKNMGIYSSEKSALYYLGFNIRKKPFNDISFRQAVATLINKDFIVKVILQGYGKKMDSIVPPGNTFWYNPNVPRYGERLSREERILKASAILNRAGYTWKVPPVNPDGTAGHGEGIIMPDGNSMNPITVLTPSAGYDPQRAMVGQLIQQWLRLVGIPALSRPMAFGSLLHRVKALHEFDLFILGYGNLSLDPDYLRNFFHSRNDKPGDLNMSGYKNSYYDRLAEESANAMDKEKRRAIIWEMQKIIMQDIPYIPLYDPELIEGVRDDKFRGWVEMLGGVGNIWSFSVLRPK